MYARTRLGVALNEAHELGYRLLVIRTFDVPLGPAYVATAAQKDSTTARFLTYGPTKADVAEAGVAILRGIVERGDAWPLNGIGGPLSSVRAGYAPPVLEALRADLSELERCSTAREPFEPEVAPELYAAVSDVREALRRLVEELEARERSRR